MAGSEDTPGQASRIKRHKWAECGVCSGDGSKGVLPETGDGGRKGARGLCTAGLEWQVQEYSFYSMDSEEQLALSGILQRRNVARTHGTD